jgi:hypothetical protein
MTQPGWPGYQYRKYQVLNQTAGEGVGSQVPLNVQYYDTPILRGLNRPYRKKGIVPISLGSNLGVVHPDVHYFPDGLDGYKYWLFYTPYPPESAEKPCLLRSNDLETWVSTGVTNPLVNHDGPTYFLADPDVTYVDDLDTWFMVYAKNKGAAQQNRDSFICLAYSSDGKSWTTYNGMPINGNTNPVIISGQDSGGVAWERLYGLSWLNQPSIAYNNGVFTVFYMGPGANNQQQMGSATFTWNKNVNSIENFTRNSGNPIISAADLPADSLFKAGLGHPNYSKYNGIHYIHAVREILSTTNYESVLLSSADMENWTYEGRTLRRGGSGEWDSSEVYRNCPIVDKDDNIVLFDGEIELFYSAFGDTSNPNIGMAVTDARYSISVNELCNPDFSDIKFTKDDGKTFLDYYIKRSKTSDFAEFIVELGDDLSAADKNFCVYYGKSDDASLSNAANTTQYHDNGTTSNFAEATIGNASISRNGGLIVSEGAVSDAFAVGCVLTSLTNLYVEVNNVAPPSGNTKLTIGLFDAATVAGIMGPSDIVAPYRRFTFTRSGTSTGTPGKVLTSYWDASGTEQRWNGNSWGTTQIWSDIETGNAKLVMWSDDNNLYADAYGSTGESLYRAPSVIPIASIKPFTNGIVLAVTDLYTDFYIISGMVYGSFYASKLVPIVVRNSFRNKENIADTKATRKSIFIL